MTSEMDSYSLVLTRANWPILGAKLCRGTWSRMRRSDLRDEEALLRSVHVPQQMRDGHERTNEKDSSRLQTADFSGEGEPSFV